MLGWITRTTGWFLLAAGLGFSGCSPTTENVVDEQADANFIAGSNRAKNSDFGGAIESFEKALETNPRSASAHFELGLIYYQKLTDYAEAIHHFRKFLQLRPTDSHADTVRQFINVSIQELARSVSLGPVSIEVQKQMERLADENWKLKQQVNQLQTALAAATNRTAGQAVAAPVPTNPTASAVANANLPPEKPTPKSTPSPATSSQKNGTKANASTTQAKPRATESAASATGRTHVVRAGESAESIARRYGIRFSSLLVANPQLDPKKMKPGQVLKIPAS